MDLGLVKGFRASDRLVTTFRLEAFNAFNRVNRGNPTTAQNNGNFLRITSAGDPRIPQMAPRQVF